MATRGTPENVFHVRTRATTELEMMWRRLRFDRELERVPLLAELDGFERALLAKRCARVTFEPGARTAWHTHPLGQTLIVTQGIGRVQRAGGGIHEIRPGDVVWFAPGERHWHGAARDVAMTHIAIQEELDGVSVDWQEPVVDDD